MKTTGSPWVLLLLLLLDKTNAAGIGRLLVTLPTHQPPLPTFLRQKMWAHRFIGGVCAVRKASFHVDKVELNDVHGRKPDTSRNIPFHWHPFIGNHTICDLIILLTSLLPSLLEEINL